MIVTDNGRTVWSSMAEELPDSGWVWLWGPQLGIACWLVSDETPPDGAWMWASCNPPEPPASIRTFAMHMLSAELSGRDPDEGVMRSVELLGWDDALKEHVDAMRRALIGGGG